MDIVRGDHVDRRGDLRDRLRLLRDRGDLQVEELFQAQLLERLRGWGGIRLGRGRKRREQEQGDEEGSCRRSDRTQGASTVSAPASVNSRSRQGGRHGARTHGWLRICWGRG